VIDGVTGYRFQTGNIDALAAAMISVNKMSENRLAVAKECLTVIAGFTPARAASQLLDGCMTILGDAERMTNSRAA
jgi:glycosyltransferase involved in cell wall biosynthesis